MSLLDIATKLVPLLRNRKLDKYDFISDVEKYWNEHKNRIVENWYLYLGYHNIFFSRFDGENERDFIKRVENAVIENHIQPIIDIICAYIYGGKITRYITRNGKIDENLMNILHTKVWNHNSELYDDIKCVNTLVTGYTLVQRSFVDYRTNLPFLPVDSNINKAKYGYIKKIPLDSMCAIPLPYISEDGRVIPDKFSGVVYYAEYDNLIGNNDVMQLIGAEYQKSKVLEYIDDRVWLRYISKQENDWKLEFAQDNPYGRVDILFSLYKNTGDLFSVEGESEITKLKKLNIDLNELSDGDRNVIRSHQYPILLGKKGATLPNNFVRTKDAVIDGIEGDGTFEYLTWTGNFEESRLRQEILRKAMSYVSGVSGITRGIVDNLGQVRSGSPLKALMSSDHITKMRKERYFSHYEKEEMKADLLFYQASTGIDLNLTPDIEFNIEFDEDLLGIDTLINEEINAIKLGAGMIDIETVLREQYPDWTDEQIKDVASKINTAKSDIKPIRKSMKRAELEQK